DAVLDTDDQSVHVHQARAQVQLLVLEPDAERPAGGVGRANDAPANGRDHRLPSTAIGKSRNLQVECLMESPVEFDPVGATNLLREVQAIVTVEAKLDHVRAKRTLPEG